MEQKKPVCCPNCNQALGLEVTAILKSESSVQFRLLPLRGELFSPRVFGAALVDIDKLFMAAGQDIGEQTMVMLEKVETDAEGGMTAHLLIARGPDTAWRRAENARAAAARKRAANEPNGAHFQEETP